MMGKVLPEESAAIHRWDHVCQKPLFRNQRIPLGWYFHRNRKRRKQVANNTQNIRNGSPGFGLPFQQEAVLYFKHRLKHRAAVIPDP